MKKSVFLPKSKLLIAIGCFFATLFVSSQVLTAQPFKLFGVSDLKRVFEDGYKLPPALDTVKIFGIRGEVISGQCALNT